MGHVWLGFGDDQLRRLLAGRGFDDIRIVPLPVGSGSERSGAVRGVSESRCDTAPVRVSGGRTSQRTKRTKER